MKLKIKNIGKVAEADIEIKGITVIAGANNTGKSTVGKALYSVFNSVSDIDGQEWDARIAAIRFALMRLPAKNVHSFQRYKKVISIAKKILEEWTLNSNQHANIYKVIENIIFEELNENTFFELENNEHDVLEDIIQQIIESINISSETILVSTLERRLNQEFKGQICNFHDDNASEIILTINKKDIQLRLSSNGIEKIHNALNLRTKTIYLDNPYVIDELEDGYEENNHREKLRDKLRENSNEIDMVSGIILENNLQEVYNKINSVCIGSMKRENDSFVYQENAKSKPIFVENLSTGLKTFVILKTLLQNGSIEKKGSIVLDEPEVHLHPKWQLIFAELLVLLQKTFDLHILLNTHSPYFLRAIQVYAAKHEVADMCKYYLAKLDGSSAYIDDVSNDIEQIFESLASPLQTLRDEEF